MKATNNIKRFYAWVLLLTFTLMLSVKSIHVHYEHGHNHTVSTEQSHSHASIKASCYVCDFAFQKADAVKTITYFLTQNSIIVKLLSFSEQLVYHFILSIKANSPPLF